jgi:serine/threonine protein kinase
MPKDRDPDASLSKQRTFQGKKNPKMDSIDAQSLGEQVTRGGVCSDGGHRGGAMEIIDLDARYKIESPLGKGGMGEVLLATDTRLNRKVAIKRILGKTVRNRTAVNRFLTEAKSIAALNHPNIVNIYDFGRATDGPFLIMEYVDGGSLLDRCCKGAIPLEEAVDLACQLADGLERAHSAGIIHRDIKPANILLTKNGSPKLTDFGLAKAESAGTAMTMAGAVLGTLDFMPPEQRLDAALTDARSDLWSLAATLYQMVTGESPRVIDMDTVPFQVRSVLSKALKTKKEDRYQSAREMKEALKQSLLKQGIKADFIANSDLGTGECPSCHVANESRRKYCRECGEPLRCECFKCQHEIPVWDKICPECGGKQTEMATSIIDECGEQRERAEELRRQYQYSRALELAEKIAAMTDRRIAVHADWAKEFVISAKAEWEREKAAAQEQYEEAKKHREAFDYDAAIRAIDAIPNPLRDREIYLFFRRLRSDHQESLDLLKTIKERVDRGSLGGLLKTVDMALKLCGDKDGLKALRGQLQEREKKIAEGLEKLAEKRERLAQEQEEKAFTSAESLFAEGRAKEALILLEPYRGSQLNADRKNLIRKIERLYKLEAKQDNFSQLIAQAENKINTEDYLAAIFLYRSALRIYPHEIKAMIALANCQHKSMLTDNAIATLEKAKSIAFGNLSNGLKTRRPYPTSPPEMSPPGRSWPCEDARATVCYKLASYYWVKKESSKVIANLGAAILGSAKLAQLALQDPSFSGFDFRAFGCLLAQKAKADFQNEDWSKAVEKSLILHRLLPNDTKIPVFLANSLHRLGKTPEAISVCQELLKKHPELAIGHYNLACYQCGQGNRIDALNNLQKAISIDKKYANLARKDKDFKAILDDGEFLRITKQGKEAWFRRLF